MTTRAEASISASVLRTYAAVLEKPRAEYDPVLRRKVQRRPGEILLVAASALRFQAATIELRAVEEGKLKECAP